MDLTAQRIAADPSGQWPIYKLATTGAMPKEIYAELAAARHVIPERETWIEALSDYCLSRLHVGPISDWHELEIETNE